jgi:hypothetical protein
VLTYTDGNDGGEFTTAIPDWKIGDTFLTRDGRLRIVDIVPELVSESVYDALWMVESFEPV